MGPAVRGAKDEARVARRMGADESSGSLAPLPRHRSALGRCGGSPEDEFGGSYHLGWSLLDPGVVAGVEALDEQVCPERTLADGVLSDGCQVEHFRHFVVVDPYD